MSKVSIIVVSAFIAIGLLGAGCIAIINFLIAYEANYKLVIAEDVRITSEWLEIRTKKPLETSKLWKHIILLIEGYEHDNSYQSDFGNIRLQDGRIIHPEIEIIDENGRSFKLTDSRRVGEFIGFSLDDELNGTNSLPKDGVYKTIRIRSNIPFLCKKIYWQNNNGK